MTCRGSGYIICRCYGDAQPAGVEGHGCIRCGGNGPCPGCENCEGDELSDEQILEEAVAEGIDVPAEAERVRQTLLTVVQDHRRKVVT